MAKRESTIRLIQNNTNKIISIKIEQEAAQTPPKPLQYVLVWTDDSTIHGKAVNIRRTDNTLYYDLVFEPRTFNIASYSTDGQNKTQIVPKVTIDNATQSFVISNITSSHITLKRNNELGFGKNGKLRNDWTKEVRITLSIPEGNKTLNKTVYCVIDNENEIDNY